MMPDAVRLRICHLGKYYPPARGGMEAHVQTLARAQVELGHEVQVIALRHDAGPTTTDQDGAIAVTRVGRLASVAKLDYCPGLARLVARAQADVIHVHVPNPTMLLALLAARPSAAVVGTYHSDHVAQRMRGALFRPLEHLAYRNVRAIIATSPTYAAGSPFLQQYADRLHVVPHGIDLAPCLDPSAVDRAAAEEIRRRHPGPRWLACGRLIYYKGLIHAVRALPHTTGTLVLVGDGPERGALAAEAARLGLGQRVCFAGSVERVVPYFLAADALWFPSNARSEAFGLVQVEAMACGCPVINTSIPASGVAWVSPHEETGLTVPTNDPAALAAAANRLLAETGLRQRLADAGQRRAQQEFDHRVMAQRTADVYRQVLARFSGELVPSPAAAL